MKVFREGDYLEKQSEQTSQLVTGMGIVIAILFSLGAMIGASITMNGAVAHRTKEIGSLRALGFTRFAILTAFILVAVVLSLLGGGVGLLGALLLSLKSLAVMNFQTFSEIVIRFQATPSIVVTALVFSAATGLVGGLFPAIRASRISPAEAMRGG